MFFLPFSGHFLHLTEHRLESGLILRMNHRLSVFYGMFTVFLSLPYHKFVRSLLDKVRVRVRVREIPHE